MVFVLDTSGSIGQANFEKMTSAISKFVPLFCDNLKVAIVSYSHDINLEFCFNCHNLCPSCLADWNRLNSSIQGIRYRGGLTHTGTATRCVQDYILNPSLGCGADTSSDCLDVIYIIDGHSNGPLRHPATCNEVTCLKNDPTWCGKVNTYAIAIGSGVNRREIECMTQSNEDSVFNVVDFEDLERLVNNAITMLVNPSSYYMCINHTDRDILL